MRDFVRMKEEKSVLNESQRLLTPILVEMSPAQRRALAQHAATLDRFGLEIEEFGGDSLRLCAVPAVFDPAEV